MDSSTNSISSSSSLVQTYVNCTEQQNYCGQHGLCLDSICRCMPYWQGDDCSQSFKSELGGVFSFWRIVFILSYGCLLIYMLVRLMLDHIHRKSTGKKVYLKSISYLLLIFTSTSRILYLALDPMKQTLLVPGVITELLGGLSLYFLFTSYLVVLLYWAALYHQVFEIRKKLFIPVTKWIFIIVDGIWLVMEIVIRILYGLQIKSYYFDKQFSITDNIYNCYIASIALLFSLSFMVYGSLIYSRIRKSKFEKKTKERAVRKLTFIITILSWTFLFAAVSLILIIKFRAMKSPFGAIFALSAQFFLEIGLILEMFYVLKDDPASKQSNRHHRFRDNHNHHHNDHKNQEKQQNKVNDDQKNLKQNDQMIKNDSIDGEMADNTKDIIQIRIDNSKQ